MKYLDSVKSPEDLKRMTVPELQVLCLELREFLIETISVTGGHLASNLGVVELSVALHYCYNSPLDKIIWDVGHQAYVHKILTGRMGAFNTLRRLGGLSGFPKASESAHDAFDTGHSSTSISAALGYCLSRDLQGGRGYVAAVIGDGSMTGGLAFEGLNNAGRANTNLLVILNDNQMSISENVGALQKYLNKLRIAPSYLNTKSDINRLVSKLPFIGAALRRALEKAKNTLRYLLVPGVMFEEMGFTYVGPVDGHNMEELIGVLSKVKNIPGPVLLHVYTTKGKGYLQSEASPAKFHGVNAFDVETGKPIDVKLWDTYTDVFGKELVKIASADPRVTAVTAAMPSGVGFDEFRKVFPSRLFDVGIAEAHAVTFAAGMAKSGLVPVVAVYSTFLQRAYDQILHDVCLQNLHVIFAIDRAGVVGADGETHQGLFDLAFLSHMPNMTIMAPMNKKELEMMLRFALSHGGPVAIRYPKAAASRLWKGLRAPIIYGRSQLVAQGETDAAIVSVGAMMEEAYETWKMLKAERKNPALYNARFVKPVDESMLRELSGFKHVFFMEDGAASGGYFSNALAKASELGINTAGFHGFAFPDKFIEHGERHEIFAAYGMDAGGLFKKISRWL
ncbi:MAG: 1-deoxy-D-xylulose-5-phosphate synthase [Clostridiales bacterium]|nr:1-deoxy-D-xylulose-5-phosphate synthase [Clostridiales bacterium]